MHSLLIAIVKSQLIRYLLVGFCIFLIYSSLIYFFLNFLNFDYLIGISLSYIISVVIHFYLNRTFSFQVKSKNLRVHMLKYVALLLINYSANMGVCFALVTYYFFTAYWAAILGVVMTTAIGFFMSKLWIFVDD